MYWGQLVKRIRHRWLSLGLWFKSLHVNIGVWGVSIIFNVLIEYSGLVGLKFGVSRSDYGVLRLLTTRITRHMSPKSSDRDVVTDNDRFHRVSVIKFEDLFKTIKIEI